MGLQTQATVLGQDFRDISSTQQEAFGTEAQTSDGRRFRYAGASTTALAPGKMNDGSAVAANHVNLVTAAAAVGATQVTVTLGATAATLNQYAGGVLYSNSTSTGQGVGYRIKGHAAVASSGTGVFFLDEPIVTAITATTKISLFASLYNNAIITPSAATPGGPAIGVFTGASLTASYFGWLQVAGVAPLLCAATVYTLGEEVSQGVSLTAGAGSLKVATHPGYGDAMQLGISTEYQLVNLRLN